MENRCRLMLLVFIFVVSNDYTYAQTISFCLGLNASYFGGNKYDGQTYNHDVQSLSPIYGLNSGVHINFPNKPIFNNLYFETGLDFIVKGSKEKYIFSQFNTSKKAYDWMTKLNSIRINYLSLPFKINSIIKIKNINLILSPGIYFAEGISGHVDSKNFWVDSGNPVSSNYYKINWTQNIDGYDYKRRDWGITLGTGIQKGQFQVLIQIDRGFKTINIFENHILSFKLSTSYFVKLKK
jgi:hypothetical protein